MKIIKPKSKKAPLLITGIAIAALLAIGSVVYVYAFDGNLFGWHKPYPNDSVNYNEATQDQKDAGTQAKQNSANTDIKSAEGANKPTSSGSDPLPAPQPQPSGKASVGVSITASSQAGSIYQIRSLISALTSNGSCTLTLTKGSATVIKTAKVQTLANSATCQGFDIPVSELSPGTWSVSLVFENSEIQGNTTATITVK